MRIAKPPQENASHHSVVESAAEELEVVRGHDERTEGDEDEEPEAPADGRPDADRDRAGKGGDADPNQHVVRDLGPERPAVPLVQHVSRDAEGQHEGDHRPHHPVRVEVRRQRGAGGDVRRVPGGVGQVEHGDVIAPAARAERVEGGF